VAGEVTGATLALHPERTPTEASRAPRERLGHGSRSDRVRRQGGPLGVVRQAGS
jgi:hypothetical protein